MAAVTASSACAATCLLQKTLTPSKSVSVKPQVMAAPRRSAAVVCTAEAKGLPKIAAAVSAAVTLAATHPALALVDERLSTEGMGLSLGINSSALTIALLATAGGIWSLYSNYSSSLPPSDDDSGLGL